MTVAVLVSLLLGVCAWEDAAGIRAGDLVVAERLIGPAVDPAGVVFSVALRNEGDAAVPVTEVVAIADDGLDVEVLGGSSCRRGCAGVLGWREAQPILENAILWPEEFVLPPEADVQTRGADPVWVVLRVRPADAAAERRLQEGCLFVRELLVRIDGGPPQPLTNRLGEFVVALDRPDAGAPGVTRGCSVLD
jgi:hypothetical protein